MNCYGDGELIFKAAVSCNSSVSRPLPGKAVTGKAGSLGGGDKKCSKEVNVDGISAGV